MNLKVPYNLEMARHGNDALDSLEVFNAGWPKNYYKWNLVGSDKPYHYLGSGKFFVRLGDAFATGMAEMIPKP